jgi:hypothetical protein
MSPVNIQHNRLQTSLQNNANLLADAIKIVQTNKGKLMSIKEDDKELHEPDYDEDKDRLEETQEENIGEIT